MNHHYKWKGEFGSIKESLIPNTYVPNTSEATEQRSSRECQHTLHLHLDQCAPPSSNSGWAEWHIYSESNDSRYQKWEGSSVVSGLRNLSNEYDKKALLAQGRSIQNWVAKCILKEKLYVTRHIIATFPISSAKTTRVGVGQVGWSAGLEAAATECKGSRLIAGVAILGQQPLLVIYSETKLP